jgi:hypothetical protein
MGTLSLSRAKLSGSFESTATGVTNVTSVSVENAFYTVNGDVIMCFLTGLIMRTGAGAVEFRLTLPYEFNQDFTNADALIGHGSIGDGGFSVRAEADVAISDEVSVVGDPGSASEVEWAISFVYRLGIGYNPWFP